MMIICRLVAFVLECLTSHAVLICQWNRSFLLETSRICDDFNYWHLCLFWSVCHCRWDPCHIIRYDM